MTEPEKDSIVEAGTFDPGLLGRVARSIARWGMDGAAPQGSILTQAASSYGAHPIDDEATIPTGFDPAAAALFEAVVEAAFLLANSDGVFDPDERVAFEEVVSQACGQLVQRSQLDALLSDLTEQLAEDGIEKRVRMVCRTITREEHQLEVLRIGALMAHISGGVSEPERRVMELLAAGFQLGAETVDQALEQAEAALKGTN